MLFRSDTINYHLKVANCGDAITPMPVKITDIVPTGVSYIANSLEIIRANSDNTQTTLTPVDNPADIGTTHYYSDPAALFTLTLPPLDIDCSYIISYDLLVDGDINDPNGSKGGVKYTFDDIVNVATMSYDEETTLDPVETNSVTITSNYS